MHLKIDDKAKQNFCKGHTDGADEVEERRVAVDFLKKMSDEVISGIKQQGR